MSPELTVFLSDIRHHPLFPQLLAAIEYPRLPEYRPGKGDTLEMVGAKAAYASGQLEQYRQWHLLLTGINPSEKGDKT